MISFAKYGYKHQDAFRKAVNVPTSTFYALAADPSWHMAKNVLLHPECPIALRDRFRKHAVWYKRLVAILAKAAPPGYYHYAKNDSSPTVRRAYRNHGYKQRTALLILLEKTKAVSGYIEWI